MLRLFLMKNNKRHTTSAPCRACTALSLKGSAHYSDIPFFRQPSLFQIQTVSYSWRFLCCFLLQEIQTKVIYPLFRQPIILTTHYSDKLGFHRKVSEYRVVGITSCRKYEVGPYYYFYMKIYEYIVFLNY